ncbi:hypothetical protein FRC03_009768 [Tulasnella sp. 419]|nr:hypothetical protein FRC03_009768 [Tulasnella sp. 419]
MRGSQTPVANIDWAELPPLEKLELSAAREAFVRIRPRASDDPELDTLLRELDCVPLAITLMASLARGRNTPSDLFSRWRSERTKMLSKPGGDRLNNSTSKSEQLSKHGMECIQQNIQPFLGSTNFFLVSAHP